MAQMGGAVSFLLEVCSKNTGLQGSTLSGPHMTTGFDPFELPRAHYGKGGQFPDSFDTNDLGNMMCLFSSKLLSRYKDT